MLELVTFPYLPSGDPQSAVTALIQMCRELPQGGEMFHYFRKRMKEHRLWDQDRVQGTLDFLGMERVGQIKPSPLVSQIAAQRNDNVARDLLTTRMWEVNPLLFKTVIDLLKERVYSRDEVIKHIDSFAYRGKQPVRPQLEAWLHMALGLDILKMVGIALDLGPRGKTYLPRAAELDVEDFLEEVRLAAESKTTGAGETPTKAALDDDRADAAPEEPAAPAPAPHTQEGSAGPAAAQPDRENVPVSQAPAAQPVAPARNAPTAAPARAPEGAAGGARQSTPSPALAFPRDALTSPRGRHPVTQIARFSGHRVFPDDILGETASRVQSWWAEQQLTTGSATIEDFGVLAEHWIEGSDEALYRIAVAAALVFRLGKDRDATVATFASLDRSGVLGDLYHGTAPDELPDNLDPKALMLASLVARRLAESPELASTLDQQSSAKDAFGVLDRALGRGLFKIELFWILSALAQLGAARFPDLAAYTALPRRLVRDTLFRLGFLDTPYAHEAAELLPAAASARRAVGTVTAPPDEVLTAFAVAAGCNYDCPNRRNCEYACRERLDS